MNVFSCHANAVRQANQPVIDIPLARAVVSNRPHDPKKPGSGGPSLLTKTRGTKIGARRLMPFSAKVPQIPVTRVFAVHEGDPAHPSVGSRVSSLSEGDAVVDATQRQHRQQREREAIEREASSPNKLRASSSSVYCRASSSDRAARPRPKTPLGTPVKTMELDNGLTFTAPSPIKLDRVVLTPQQLMSELDGLERDGGLVYKMGTLPTPRVYSPPGRMKQQFEQDGSKERPVVLDGAMYGTPSESRVLQQGSCSPVRDSRYNTTPQRQRGLSYQSPYQQRGPATVQWARPGHPMAEQRDDRYRVRHESHELLSRSSSSVTPPPEPPKERERTETADASQSTPRDGNRIPFHKLKMILDRLDDRNTTREATFHEEPGSYGHRRTKPVVDPPSTQPLNIINEGGKPKSLRGTSDRSPFAPLKRVSINPVVARAVDGWERGPYSPPRLRPQVSPTRLRIPVELSPTGTLSPILQVNASPRYKGVAYTASPPRERRLSISPPRTRTPWPRFFPNDAPQMAVVRTPRGSLDAPTTMRDESEHWDLLSKLRSVVDGGTSG